MRPLVRFTILVLALDGCSSGQGKPQRQPGADAAAGAGTGGARSDDAGTAPGADAAGGNGPATDGPRPADATSPRLDAAAPPPDASAIPPDAGTLPATTACPVLPIPPGAGAIVRPDPPGLLAAAVSAAGAGVTILLADGTYGLGGAGLQLRRQGLTLRSMSGDATKVILDGEYRTPEIIAISASDVTVAHVTITRAVDHPVHVYPEGAERPQRAAITGCASSTGASSS
jgi:hypothetical protein